MSIFLPPRQTTKSVFSDYEGSNYMTELYLSDVSSVDSCQSRGVSNHNEDHDHDNDHYHEKEEDEQDEQEDWEDFLDNGKQNVDHTQGKEVSLHQETSLTGQQLVVHPLAHSWNYYYHLPNDKNWNLESYQFITEGIDSVEKLIGINEMVSDHIIRNCMLFVMRRGITPMWEDVQNRNGGSFSYKVVNKTATQIWRKVMYLLCGNSLTVDPDHMDFVNGITISPKKGFCILKIWMKNCKLQDPSVIVNVDALSKNGCLFKAHSPEF